MTDRINLLGYVTIKGIIRCLTGIHIGGSADSIDKGGIDSPVIKNPVTNEPYIPGSSFRGRMRCILEKALGLRPDELVEGVNLHYLLNPGNDDSEAICRIFGGFKSEEDDNQREPIPSALIVRDCLLKNKSDYMDGKLPITEAKMETAIDRITSGAHPRTIERVPANAKFSFKLIYKVQTRKDGTFNTDDNIKLREDIEKILWAMEIIEKHDGLGGHTARGYGQVQFIVDNLDAVEIDLDTKAFEPDMPDFTYNTEETNYNSIKSIRVANIVFPEHPPAESQDTTETETETETNINTTAEEPETKA